VTQCWGSIQRQVRTACYPGTSVDDQEEIFQKVLTKLVLRGHTFDPQQRFWGFLGSIIRSTVADHFRPRSSKITVLSGNFSEGDVQKGLRQLLNYFDEPPGREETPAFNVAWEDMRENLRVLACRLGPKYAIVLLLHWDGCTFKEIAKTLGIAQSTAKERFERAMDQLHLEFD